MSDFRGPAFSITDAADGRSLAALPPADIKRWVLRRKAEVVAAVRHGVISLEDACERYKLSIEEFLAWQRLVDAPAGKAEAVPEDVGSM